MSNWHRRVRGFIGSITALAMGATLVAFGGTTAAAEEPPVPFAATDQPWVDPALHTGLTSDTAAASCWEIKQLNPTLPSGAYWLLTPEMAGPAQFWCDQDTDGGGWVRVGQGRQNWEHETAGRGSSSALLQELPAADSGTTQLPTKLIDGLMNNKPVTALTDGIRVRRAMNVDGTSWQEVRFKPTKEVGWFWTMGAVWPLSSWRVGTTTGTSGRTSSFGSGSGQLAVNTTNTAQNQNYTWSFSYGSSVTGSPAAGSYLWSAATNIGAARPYSFVYVRPELMSADLSYPRVANSGTVKVEQEIVPDANALTNPWGVTGLAAPRQREGDVEVQDMVAVGNTMYVGGLFRYVQRDEAGTGQVEQPFLAAFNATTGEFIPSFKPVLNEAVLAVAPAGNGRLAIGGKFTTVGGQARAGFAIIDAATGALSGPQANLTNSSSPGVVRVEAIKAGGGDLYIGGSFTHTAGPTGATRYTRNVSRINATSAMPVVGWQPEFNGSVNDLDVGSDGSKVFFAGFFTQIGAETANRAAALPTSGAATPFAWSPVWSSSNDYQRAIETKGNQVYVGGSEHSMFAFDTTTFERLSTHVTDPKGDFQTLLIAGDFLYGGSHSNWYIYQGATNWSNVGSAWSRADAVSWVNAWRLDGDKNRAVESFTPAINSRTGEAGWATAEAPNGTIWTGGDFTRARVQGGGGAWTGAFVRFGFTDGAAPNTPTNFRSTSTSATTATLAWNAPSGGIGNGGSYQIIRDNRVIASTTSTSIAVPLGGERRYFVRAADRAGNISASSSVLTIAGGNPAPVPSIQHTVNGLNVAFDASGSADNGSISAYYWTFGDGSTSTDPVVTHLYAHGGTYEVRLTVVDNEGAWTTSTYSLELAQPAPTDTYGAAVFGDQPWAYWRLNETSGTNAADVATGQHNATYQQGVTRGVGGIVPEDVAARFDGSNDVVVSSDLIPAPTTYSTEAWFRTTTTRGGKIIGFGGSPSGLSSSYDRHVYMQDDGRLVYGVYVGGEYKITTDRSLNDGLWHHVVATQSGDGMRLYVDGVLAGSNPQSNAEGSSGYWRVGGDRTWGSTSSYFAGDIDEAAIYTTALTSEQVQAHYSVGWHLTAPVVTDPYATELLGDNPSLYWRLDGSQLGTIPDASPNGLNGVIVSAPVQTTNSGVADGFGSMTFDGVDDGVALGGAALPGPTAYASEVWFRTTTTRGGKLMGFGNLRTGNSGSYDRHVYMLNDGKIVAGVWTGQQAIVTTPTTYNDGKWHHVVAQVGGSTLSLYVDGVLIGNATLQAAIQSYNGYWRLGGDTRWAGESNYFAGELDEFAVYAAPLSETRIQAHYATGAATPNQLPTASFVPTVDHFAVSVNGEGSSDPDGTIVSYKWEFGDGSDPVTTTAPTAEHTYAAAGDFTIELTVTDNRGGTATTTHDVTVGVQESGQIIAESSDWRYYYDSAAPASGWKSQTFDDSGWSSGPAPIGYGSTLVTTNLNPASATNSRPLTAYFRKDFTVVDPFRVTMLQATVIADDGVVIYVNGTEVKRHRMAAGTVTHTTYATSALRTTAANADAVVFEIPTSLLVAGRNVIAAETHLNYRATPDISFKLKADITVSSTPINQAPKASIDTSVTNLTVDVDGSDSSDPDGTISNYVWNFGDGTTKSGVTTSHTYTAAGSYTIKLTVTDNQGETGEKTTEVTVAPAGPVTQQLVAESASWRYYYNLVAPAASWASSSFNDSAWSSGAAPLGYGSSLVTTTLPVAASTSDRPKAMYFRTEFTVEDTSKVTELQLTGVADDGVVIYVNGVEVKRQNMPTGTITHESFATAPPPRTTAANGSPVVVQVPTNLLVNGTNVISASTHVNYRGTPDISFKLKAVATLTD